MLGGTNHFPSILFCSPPHAFLRYWLPVMLEMSRPCSFPAVTVLFSTPSLIHSFYGLWEQFCDWELPSSHVAHGRLSPYNHFGQPDGRHLSTCNLASSTRWNRLLVLSWPFYVILLLVVARAQRLLSLSLTYEKSRANPTWASAPLARHVALELAWSLAHPLVDFPSLSDWRHLPLFYSCSFR